MRSVAPRRRIAHCLLLTASGLLLAASLAAQDRAAPNSRTVWDGVYTEAQAERGRASYQQACVSCHRDDLRGDSTAPSLVGESFTFLWGDMEVRELSARIQKLMPPERPGSLPTETIADIVAFILQENAFPAGSMELGSDQDTLRILITATPPGK